jgi:arylsulfatase A-like enzyme
MKIVFRRVIVLLYLGVVLLGLLILIKPGASLFFQKVTVDARQMEPESGFAYRYPVNVDWRIFSLDRTLLFEDGKQLKLADVDRVATKGNGKYALSNPENGPVFLYFSPSGNSDPTQNGKVYRLFIPLKLITRLNGGVLLVLLAGLGCLGVYAFSSPQRRATLKRAPLSVIPEMVQPIRGVFLRKTDFRTWVRSISPGWKRLFVLMVIAGYVYIFMEWVFFITMPSFMDIFSLLEKVEIFLLSGFLLAIVGMLLVALFYVLSLLLYSLHLNIDSRYLAAVVPAAILTALGILLVDNFTYTVFHFGIVTSAGIWRGVYGLLVVVLGTAVYGWSLNFVGLEKKASSPPQTSRYLNYLVVGLLAVSALLVLLRFNYRAVLTPAASETGSAATSRPHIILLGSDGVNAVNMSVYGYERDTTPRIEELAQTSLFGENAFTNSANSAGSIVSILSGKMSTRTRVQYPPDILKGVDAFQHLPGILKTQGYSTYELGVPHYIDAYTLNMQNGFDWVNGRSRGNAAWGSTVTNLGFDNVAYFLSALAERITDRVLHVFYIRTMLNPFTLVTEAASPLDDQAKINEIIRLVEQSDQPVFIHAHLMGTHGPQFDPVRRVYSIGEEQTENWMTDFYDDAILNFDDMVGGLVDELKASGQLDNTVLILYSDHAQRYYGGGRIPLIIHFPRGEHAAKIVENVQNIDIAPTVLEYMGLPRPDWMDGRSLLSDHLDPHHLIFVTQADSNQIKIEEGNFTLDINKISPPFYQFGFVYIIDCNQWYQINLRKLTWSSGEVSGYIDPCSPSSMLSLEQIKAALADHLASTGFDISTLP